MASCLDDLGAADRIGVARWHLDSIEAWLRRLIDHKLSAAFGDKYFDATLPDGTPVIPKRIRLPAQTRQNAESDQFTRLIDATMFDDTIDLVLHPNLYQPHFAAALKTAFPDGAAEARTFLRRLVRIRNKVQHGGTCSTREIEQCVCYSNDVIESIKAFFAEVGMAREFNVPTFVRVVDNHGNERHLGGPPKAGGVDFRSTRLSVGDRLTVEVEVDANFSDYQVRWTSSAGGKIRQAGSTVAIDLGPQHVGERFVLIVDLISGENWHRFGKYDDRLLLRYKVLPPRKQ